MGVYGLFNYGETTYGLSAFPVSVDFDIFDFCEPNDSQMLSLLSYPEVTYTRVGSFDGNNDYCMVSNDGIDSGFRVDTAVPNIATTLQFAILPNDLPQDFSNTGASRFSVLVMNEFHHMFGLLISENAGLALTTDGVTVEETIPDSADLFDEGVYYYVFRITMDYDTGKANIYITRSDLLAVTGIHEIRYTISMYSTPFGETDNVRFEVIGSAGDPVDICLDCFRLSSQLLIQNARPVAVPGDDQTTVFGQFTSFDGRSSYDPEGAPLSWWWTMKTIPEGSTSRVDVSGTTPADATGWTNRAIGAAPGVFAGVLLGDIIKFGDLYSHIMYVAEDSSYLVTVKDILPASSSVSWQILKQVSWGGARVDGSTTYVSSRESTPPGSPVDGDLHLVIATATGDFTGHEGELALWVANPALPGGGSWSFETKLSGAVIYIIDDFASYRTSGLGIWHEAEIKGWELDHWEGRVSSVTSYLSDQVGLFAAELVVNDGVLDSLPVEVLSSVYETGVQFGLTPDLNFIWNYLSDFWTVVEGREKFETFWSGVTQLLGDDMMQLWQHGYSKSLADIQRTFIRRWLNFDPLYEEPDYSELPAEVNNTTDVSGWATDPFPTPIVGEPVPDDSRSYVLDAMPSTAEAGQHLVLGGILYKIARVSGLSLVTSDEMPVTGRPQNWMIRPTITSRTSDFTDLQVAAGDSAIFEIQDADGGTQEVTCFIWGVRRSVLAFDDTPISGFLASPSYTVLFKSVLRKSAMQVDETVVSIPRLQEVIALNRVDGRPDPFIENNDFRVETATGVTGREINTIQFLEMWFEVSAFGSAGYTDGTNRDFFFDDSADFEDTFGAGADLRNYLLEIDGVLYRIYQVISATQLELFDESLEVSQTGLTWRILEMDEPPDNMWAEATYLDNSETIEANFGRLIGFTVDDLNARTDNLDYLSAVQGLWYFVWNARTPYNIEVGSQIILGLPFAEQQGTITDIQSPFDVTRSRILIEDDTDQAVTRSYFYPTELGLATNPETGAQYTAGDLVQRFAPLTGGVTVTDYIEDPEWLTEYINSGDLTEAHKFHTFGVVVDADAFDLVNLLFLVGYIRDNCPRYTRPYFVVSKSVGDTVDVEGPSAIGPVSPALLPYDTYTYPTNWPAFEIPSTWIVSPWEVPRSATPTIPPLGFDFGGLQLVDSVAFVPDGWSGAWPSGAPGSHTPTPIDGAFIVDANDQSGHNIHKVDEQLLATNIADDAGFESGDPIDDPSSPWVSINGGLGTVAKSGVEVRTGVQSCYIQSAYADVGIRQIYNEAVTEHFQVAVRVWLKILSGSVNIKLIDKDAVTVLEELRKGVPINQWIQATVHAWSVGPDAGSNPEVEIATGPAGGEFYVDDVEFYHTIVPWGQWGVDRSIRGRTGGYTFGGSPDESWLFRMFVQVP